MTVRRITEEADLRVAHEIEEASFLEHYGNVPVSYESWLDRLTDRGEDFRHVYLAELDGDAGRPADQHPAVRGGRGRGLRPHPRRAARRAAAAGSAPPCCGTTSPARTATGRRAVLLHVDVANVTGALRVYESVGMRAVLENRRLGQGRARRLTAREPVRGSSSRTLPTWLPASTHAVRLGGLGHRQHPVDHRAAPSPDSTSGQTCSRTEATTAAFSSAGRARRRGREHGAPLAHQQAEVELGPGAALHADDRQPAAGREHVEVAGQVLRAHVVEHHVGPVAVGRRPDRLDEVLSR